MEYNIYTCMCHATDDLTVERAQDGIWFSINNNGFPIQRIKLTLQDAKELRKFLKNPNK